MEQIDLTLQRKYTDREIVKRTLKYMYPVRNKFLLGIFLILINVVLNIFMPRILGHYINLIDEKNMQVGSLGSILFFCGCYFLIIVINMALTYVETVIIQKAGQEVIFTLRQEVFEKIETFSYEQLNNIPIGRLVTRVTNDTNSLNELYTMVLVNLLKYLLMIIGILINMILINWIISLALIVVMIVIIVATIIYRHFSKIAFSRERKELSNLNSFLSENLSGMHIIQIFNQEGMKKNEFDQINKNYLKARKNVMYVFAYYRPFISFLFLLSIGLVFLIGFPHVLEQREFFGTVFNFGLLMAYYTYTENFFGPIQNLTEQFDKLQSGIVSSERIFNILDMSSTIVEKEHPLVIDHFQGKVEFKNVYFAYNDNNWVLEDVSFVIQPKQTVAFIGPTGSGKTTILSLITRNYDIQKGQILIDDIDIKDIQLDCLRSKIGQMLQDVFMFSGTIKDNITLFNEEYTLQEINDSINYVNADTFINKLEKGIDTEVSEKGNNFSSGQKQLISFSRTIINKPEFLILDEATANIDTETEVIIQQSLQKMKNIGTMIVVAHRLSTIQHADNIFCMSKGRIVEQGTHQELLAKKGFYYRLYQLQLCRNNEKN